MPRRRRIGYAFAMSEVSLYAPVKKFLESLDFVVKGEIGNCDVVGVREGEPPVLVICELKMQFNLELVLQAVDRAGASDEVWLAAAMSARGKGREHDSRFRALCRRLGFGLLGVTAARRGRAAAQPCGAAAAPRSPDAIEACRRAPPPARRPRRGRQHALAGHDRLSPGRAGLRGGNGGGAEAAARPQKLHAACGQDLARQCLWLVRPRRARHLRPDRRGRAALLRWPQEAG